MSLLNHLFTIMYKNKYTILLLSQISIPALMLTVYGLECAIRTVRMTLAVSVLNNAPPIRIQCALRMEQHTTTNVGMS